MNEYFRSKKELLPSVKATVENLLKEISSMGEYDFSYLQVYQTLVIRDFDPEMTVQTFSYLSEKVAETGVKISFNEAEQEIYVSPLEN